MREARRRFHLTFACAAAICACGTAHAQKTAEPAHDPPDAFIRVLEEEGGNRVMLQTSSRAFRPRDGAGPEVHLVGVMHIGDRVYYEALQKYLDTHDLVLYEGVKPGGTDTPEALDAPARRELTERRLRLLAVLIEKHRQKTGSYPGSLDAAFETLPKMHARVARSAAVDAWGNAVALVAVGRPPGAPGAEGVDSFDLVSTGADGVPGGEGDAADLRFSDQKPLKKSEIATSEDGIQGKLADALGLEFQLTAIDYSSPKWRNSDLSVDAVQAKLTESGASGEALFSMLNGSSFSAKMLGLVLNIIKASPQSRAMGKLMIIEMLGSADQLLAAGAGGMGKMMKVIIYDRNQAVFDDLKAIIESEKDVGSVALFYGGGHIPDLERRIESELGYSFTGETWFTGIDMNLKKAGMDPKQGAAMRRMIRQSIETQLKRAGEAEGDRE